MKYPLLVRASAHKIGIIGSGNVGQVLASGFKSVGHDVSIGSRDGNKLAAFTQTSGIAEGTFQTVAAGAELLVLAVQGIAAEEVVSVIAAAIAGKVVLDATNPISGPPVDGVVPYFTAGNDSLIQRLQKRVPAAKFVKCFSSVGAHLMIKPQLKGGMPSMFICGDDADAKRTTTTLLEQVGWRAEDAGTSAIGHAVEALCQLWCAPGFAGGDWAHAFAVLRP
jgi:8-hydroxy-5-deazaflavin:NADPH oxidoreductase